MIWIHLQWHPDLTVCRFAVSHQTPLAMAHLEKAVLAKLNERDISDSDHVAQQLHIDHTALVGTIKSLAAYEMIIAEVCRTAEAAARAVDAPAVAPCMHACRGGLS